MQKMCILVNHSSSKTTLVFPNNRITKVLNLENMNLYHFSVIWIPITFYQIKHIFRINVQIQSPADAKHDPPMRFLTGLLYANDSGFLADRRISVISIQRFAFYFHCNLAEFSDIVSYIFVFDTCLLLLTV